MEDRNRRKRHFRALHSLGSNEYTLCGSCTLFGATGRNPGWTIRFRLRTPHRLHAFGKTFRSARRWKEEQVPVAGAKIPRITDRLERINTSSGRQTLAREKTKRKSF